MRRSLLLLITTRKIMQYPDTAMAPEAALDHFVSMTARSNVAVIIPLYGYWNDVANNPVNGEVLSAILKRVYSHTHNLYLIFVANPQTIPSDPSNPESIANILIAKSQGGNVKSIPVTRDATYNEYVREGMTFALQETKSQFVVVVNPWVMIQEGGIDAIVDRVNRSDDAKIVSGFDVRTAIPPSGFDAFRVDVPKEERCVSFDFLGMPRFSAEMVQFDTNYLTHRFLELDIFQSMRQKGFEVISSQRIPVFVFDFPWNDYETGAMFEQDKEYFIQKWHFDPGISYA